MPIDLDKVERTLAAARRRLLAARTRAGHWEGQLSTSALSTATAVCALILLRDAGGNEAVGLAALDALIQDALDWLATHQNADGGWGDTVDSPSNMSTTTLCWAAVGMDERWLARHQPTMERADIWLASRVPALTPPAIAEAIAVQYGEDRTFSVPILTMCALAGCFGEGREAWRHIPALPFELAVLPHRLFKWIGLPVVSYALPALIAIGQVRHAFRPTRNPVSRVLRGMTVGPTLSVLRRIQPASGGFLEAAPLTSFVLMSLVAAGRHDHAVAIAATRFLVSTVRRDGSWPIDTNLATWVTTLAVGALVGGGEIDNGLTARERETLVRWLIEQQYTVEHPYTHAAPGGWAWTDLSGGVPDADDTPGALLALWHLAIRDEDGRVSDDSIRSAAERGARWLADLQNRDGGLPTFCRGWGKLPFDRSSPDLTAHALRAWWAWRSSLSDRARAPVERAIVRAARYLVETQRSDGAWVPLWFGNQGDVALENPLYGTTRVLRAMEVVQPDGVAAASWRGARDRAIDWVLAAQEAKGGWGGAAGVPPSIEETALAVEALAGFAELPAVAEALAKGCAWLVERTGDGERFEPVPIGLYFAKLWYAEKLYPFIFTVSALERVAGAHVPE